MVVHDVLVSVHIMSEPTTARGIRLPDWLWKAIEDEATGLNMKPHEWLRRRLAASVSASRDVQKSQIAVPKSHDDRGIADFIKDDEE